LAVAEQGLQNGLAGQDVLNVCVGQAPIFPAVLHAKHRYTGVLAAGGILLDRLVCASGSANQNGAAALEKIVDPVADRRVQSRNWRVPEQRP
jgi:hypothetical protein